MKHIVPLRQLGEGEFHVAFYENFAAKPHEELDLLFNFLGRTYDDRALAQIWRPSQNTKNIVDPPIVTGKSVLESWRAAVSEADLREAVELLSLFGLDSIYSDETMPRREGLATFRARLPGQLGPTVQPAGSSRDEALHLEQGELSAHSASVHTGGEA